MNSDDAASTLIRILGGGTGFVLEVAGHVGWLVLPAVAVFLLIRKLWAHAVLVVLADLALSLLVLALTSVAAGRAWVAGNAVEFLGTCALLLLVFLPVVPTHLRVPVITGVATLAVAFELVTVLAGLQAPVPTLAGSFTGVALVAGLGFLFRARQQRGDPPGHLWEGLPTDNPDALRPAQWSGLSGLRRRLVRLLAVAVALLAGLVLAGFLITGPLNGIRQMDQAVVEWLAAHRSNPLNIAATIAGSFGTTPGIVAVLLVSLPLILALTNRWLPAGLLLTAAVGETTLYLLAGMVVGRDRPAVDHLSEGLPPTSSFPSGHVAAAVVVYGGLALLIYSTGRRGVRWIGFILAVPIVLGVAVSRLYWGVHFPSDVLASLLYAPVWLAACWKWLVKETERCPE